MKKAPTYYVGREEHFRLLTELLNTVIEGGSNAIGIFTATANTSLTIVSDPYCSEESHIDLTPLTANAASALPVTYISSRDNVGFEVTHGNNTGTDRIYSYAIRRT